MPHKICLYHLRIRFHRAAAPKTIDAPVVMSLGASGTEIDHDFLAWIFHQLCKSSGIDVAHGQDSVLVLPKANCIGAIVIEAVIFDIDGTLLDSVDLHAEAWRVAFKKFGKDVGFDAVRSQIGKGADQLLPVFLSSAELAQFGKALDEYRGDLYKRDYLPKVKAFPKVRELFQRIRQDGKRIALASSAKGDELKTYKAIAQIEDLIHAETSSDSAEKSKPHPDIFDAALEELGDVPRGHVIVVGDTPYDAQAAHKAQLQTIGMLSGGWHENDLREAGCSAIYRDAADLLANYENSPIADDE